MRRSSVKHRLISRTSEMFADDPALMELSETSTDVSALVASQLGKPAPPPRRDHKSMCSVLFSDKEEKQVRASVDKSPVPQNFSIISTVVSEHLN